MRVKTGQGTIPFITLVGIWSISALNALPGLAVSPILGKLSVIFPHSTELDIQMLTSLPSLLIIPFIILSGKLTEKINNIKLLQAGLIIFSLSGVLYLLSTKMWQLIAVSAMLGIGSGLIVPLSTGLISRFFIGDFRTKQFGYSSAITNITLVVATIATGYLAEENWRLPFVVYLLPVISIILSFYLKRSMEAETLPDSRTNSVQTGKPSSVTTEQGATGFGESGINVKHLIQVMIFYGVATYLVLVVSFNLPFLMKEYKMSSGNAGDMISLFFLAIMAPGLILDKIIRLFGNKTLFVSMMSAVIGLTLILLAPSDWVIAPGCIFTGLSYGVIQPLVYDKTTKVAIPRKATLALAFVMAMNYVAILACPFILDVAGKVFHNGTQQFAFMFNLVIAFGVAIYAFVARKSFLFK